MKFETVLNKMTKTETQTATAAQFNALCKLHRVTTEQPTPEQADKNRIKEELIKRSLIMLIDSAFRGNEEYNSTAFDLTTDLMQELKPFFNKGIGEARKKQIVKTISNYFTPEAVKGFKIACYLDLSEYGRRICFYYTENGYTSGKRSELCDIYIRDTNDSEPFNLANGYRLDWNGNKHTVKSCYRYGGELTPPEELIKKANAIYNKQKRAADKVKKLVSEINKTITEAGENVPRNAEYFTTHCIYFNDLTKENYYNSI